MEGIENNRLGSSTDLVVRNSSGLPAESEILDVASDQRIDLGAYWDVILRRRWVILSTLLIIFFTTLIATLNVKPLYRATVLMELTPQEPNVLNFQQLYSVGTQGTEAYRQTRYRVLKSRSVAERVVRRLEIYRMPEFYQGRSFFGLVERDPDPVPRRNGNESIETLREAYRAAVGTFMGRVTVEPSVRTNLVGVSFDSQDPEFAPRVANQLVTEFIEHNLQLKWDETAKASEWLSKQLVDVKAKLERSEDDLQAYARRNSIIFLTEDREFASAELEKLQEEVISAKAERVSQEALYKLVRGGGVEGSSTARNDRLMLFVQTRLADLYRRRAELAAIFKPDYPSLVQIESQIETFEKLRDQQKDVFSEIISDQYQVAVSREKGLLDILESQKAKVMVGAQKRIQYTILKREVDTSRQLYDGLLQRLKEAQVSAGMTASNIHVIDAAQSPGRRVKPRILLNLVMGIVVGGVLGIGLAFLQEYMDNTIRTSDDVERYLRLPALGLIPMHVNGKRNNGQRRIGESDGVPFQPPSSSDDGENSIRAEAYRSLRTSILLCGNPAPKSLLITSSLPREGKTTTSLNLAAALASLGNKRVLVVDCDMRRPSLHKAAGVGKDPGIVQCLTGQLDVSEVIREVPGVANLYIIPCGPIPPNPAELLSSTAAGDLFRKLSSEFDFVIVDSPPLLSVTDSRILATQMDATVLVVRGNSTPRNAVRQARTLLSSANGRTLGVALNGLDVTRSGYGYHSYSDYSRYGDGRGYERDVEDFEDPQREI